MLVLLALAAPLAFLLAIVAQATGVAPPGVFHLAFAAGAMPLVFGAVVHFVPVLARSAPAGRPLSTLPLVVLAAGLTTAATLAGGLPWPALHPTATLVTLSALAVLAWIRHRLRRCLDAPHPSAHWYALTMISLFLAVSLVPLWLIWPELRQPLRLFHLHLNLLGFFGLAAFGTLPVLLPTALGAIDAAAAIWLRRWLLPFFAGVLLIAAGAAYAPWLAVPGVLALLVAVIRLLVGWVTRFGRRLLIAAALPLSAAAAGFVALLVLGGVHAFLGLPGRAILSAWFALFLLPLVTGALAQLLPIWRHPGARSPARERFAATLGWGSGWRVLAFFAAGLGLASEWDAAWLLAGGGVTLFLIALARALYNRPF